MRLIQFPPMKHCSWFNDVRYQVLMVLVLALCSVVLSADNSVKEHQKEMQTLRRHDSGDSDDVSVDHVTVKRSSDDKRSNLRKVFLGRKRYYDDSDNDVINDDELNSMLVGLGGQYRKRPRPFLGKRTDTLSPSWIPFDEPLPAEDIGKRPHSRPFLGKR